MTDIGVYSATLQVKLTNFPAVTPVEVPFAITLLDPCLTTTLTLPTSLTPVTITALDGISSSQVFVPATDSAGDAAVLPDLCGPRTYSIVEVWAQNFVTITAPVLPATDWTLVFQSNDIADAGVHSVTLSATLDSFPGVTPATSIVSVTVQDPCLGTLLNAEAITEMTISIYKTIPTE